VQSRLRFIFMVLFFAVLAAWVHFDIRRVDRQVQGDLADASELNDLSRLEQEMLRFGVIAHRYGDGSGLSTKREVLLAYDMFASRIDSLVDRAARSDNHATLANRPVLGRLQAAVTSIRTEVGGLMPDDRAGLRAIDLILQEYGPRVAAMNAAAYAGMMENAVLGAASQRQASASLANMQWAFLIAALSGIAMLWVELRKVKKLNAQLKQRELEIRNLATTDSLTGLNNRRHFDERMEAIDKGIWTDPCHLLLLDLDGFKKINDVHGHATGDELLREVAGRLRLAAGDGSLVARLGGDEFGIVVKGAADRALATADTLIATVGRPVSLAGQQLKVGASIGIATRHDGPNPSKTMLREADLALYEAKAAGKNRISYNSGGLARYVRSLTGAALERTAA